MSRYFSTQRPVMPGSFPKPQGNRVVGIKNFDSRVFVGEIQRAAWGYIDYESPLEEKLARSYELVGA